MLLAISTHTPVRVWLATLSQPVNKHHISTHTPVRVWLTLLVSPFNFCLISTHTPVRVWPNCATLVFDFWDFNSHTREGVTILSYFLIHCRGFQLTHPWGCDSFASLYLAYWFYFNSHTREGVTYQISNLTTQLIISTHTPVRVWHS